MSKFQIYENKYEDIIESIVKETTVVEEFENLLFNLYRENNQINFEKYRNKVLTTLLISYNRNKAINQSIIVNYQNKNNNEIIQKAKNDEIIDELLSYGNEILLKMKKRLLVYNNVVEKYSNDKICNSTKYKIALPIEWNSKVRRVIIGQGTMFKKLDDHNFIMTLENYEYECIKYLNVNKDDQVTACNYDLFKIEEMKNSEKDNNIKDNYAPIQDDFNSIKKSHFKNDNNLEQNEQNYLKEEDQIPVEEPIEQSSTKKENQKKHSFEQSNGNDPIDLTNEKESIIVKAGESIKQNQELRTQLDQYQQIVDHVEKFENYYEQ